METKTKQKTETETLFRDLDKPSLHALSYALRHPDTWPQGFYWNYSDCDECAMGLAHCLWKSIPQPTDDSSRGTTDMARTFHIPYSVADSIFYGGDWTPRRTSGHLWWKGTIMDFESVTPDMVADQIDAYLASKE